MTTERAILAGGCFWGMQDLIRKLPGVVSTRVGYSGGDVPNATYRNHGTHAEAIEFEKAEFRTHHPLSRLERALRLEIGTSALAIGASPRT